MPRASRQKKRAAADVSEILVGDIILATHAGQWDADDLEPAQVLQLGCEYTAENDETRDDGMLVKFQVSNTRVIVPGPSSVRRPEEVENTASNSSGRRSRSSSRASRAQTTASPKATETAKTTVKNTNRGLVTPSPSPGTAAAAASSSGDDEECDGMDKEPPKKRGRSVETTEKTPTKKKRGASKTKGGRKEEDNEASRVESPYFAKAKKPTDDDDECDDDEMLEELKTAEPKAAKKRKAPAKKKKAGNDDIDAEAKKKPTKAAAKKKAAPKKKGKVVVVGDSDSDDDDDDDDPDDKPFKAEYAATGRATCRRCDTLIGKGELRISHVPLFRGKPGYRVYRHLPCAVFDENIQCVEDIGGWKRIQRKSQEDFDNLVKRVEDSKEEVKKEQEELRPDELVQVTFQGETRAPPPGLTASLLPFQTEGVSWMYHQEVKVPELHGGILADEMGMGKTLQTITTILDNRCKLQHSKPGAKHPPNLKGTELEDRIRESMLWDASLEEWKHEMNMVNVPKKMWSGKKQLGLRAGTLVICPVIAVTQWKTEIEKFTDGCLTIATYHGPNRAKELPLQKLIKYDIVITTYQVLEQDFRKMVSPNKVTCPNCGGKYKAEKLRVHLTYFCGDGAQKTEAQARQQRTADRPNNRRGGGGGNGKGKKGGFKKKEFPKTTITKKASKPSAATKRKGASKKATAAAKRDEHLGTKVANIFGKETYFGEVTMVRTTDDGVDLYQVTYSDGDQEEMELAEIQAANQRYQAAQTSKTPAAKQNIRSKKANGKITGKAAASKQSESSDAEEDDEEAENVEITLTTGRPSRSAALTASKIMSASMKEWTACDTKGADDDSFGDDGGDDSDDSDDDDESAISYDEEDSEGEAIPSPSTKEKKSPKNKQARKTPDSDSKDSESESSDDESVLARVRKRQKAALAQATKGKGGKKSFAKKGGKAHTKGKKKRFDDDESSEDDSDGEDRDPLEGIDLEELMKEAMEGSQMSLLHSVCWWRVVLDEAHMIKSRSSQTAAAAFSLIGVNRWALSGTPLQNRVGELYSLIRFLRIDPMAHYFCRSKGCDCKGIHYRIKNGKCQDCHHGGIQHFSHFNKHVLNPIQRDGYSGDGRLAMFKLKEEVLDKCLLRRTKETRAEDMNLPPRIVSIRTIQLHPIEKDFYDALYTQTKSSFSDYVARGTLLNNYAHIFDLLTRMRQAVDHPYLIVYSKRQMERDTLAAAGNQQPQIANGSTDCDICHEPPMGRVCSSCCGAAFCRSCVIEYMTPALEGAADAGGTPCPSCRSPFSIDLNQADTVVDDIPSEDSSFRGSSRSPKNNSDTSNDFGPSLKELANVNSGSILRRINLAEFATSTKIEALVQELVSMRKESPGSKALVFSQFVNMLDLIRWRIHCDPCLSEMGLGVRILHGSMDRKARDAALKDFKEDKSIRVLLMSLKSGGVALNLTVASHVFLVDNWWNPAAEMQAIDRTHRLGQHRCIRAVRFIAEGTVEERVLQLQEKKRLVFDGTVGRDAGSLKMLTSDDMASLFT